MSLTYSVDLPEPDDDIDAEPLETLFINIREKFGAINGTDVDPAGNFPGSMMALGSIPGDRLAAKTVAQAQIGLQAVGNAELIDATIKKGKHATATIDQLTLAQLNIQSQSLVISEAAVAPGTFIHSPVTPIPSASYDVLAVFWEDVTTALPAMLSVEKVAGNWVVRVTNQVTGGVYNAISGKATVKYIAKT